MNPDQILSNLLERESAQQRLYSSQHVGINESHLVRPNEQIV